MNAMGPKGPVGWVSLRECARWRVSFLCLSRCYLAKVPFVVSHIFGKHRVLEKKCVFCFFLKNIYLHKEKDGEN